MGLFFSSLTRNQIVAAVLDVHGHDRSCSASSSCGSCRSGRTAAAVFKQLSFVRPVDSEPGRQALRPRYGLWLSLAVFWLFLTVKVLESRKWK